jgi:hypothetical protein
LTSPFSINEHFAVVPPMSRAMMLGSSMTRPIKTAPVTPATGPDSTRAMGVLRAASKVAVPPFESMAKTGAVSPSARSLFSRSER